MDKASEVVQLALGKVGAEISDEQAQGLTQELERRGYVLVPVKPSPGLLVSMATRYAHDFGLDADADEANPSSFQMGYTSDQRAGLLCIMGQLHQEVVGTGFYSEDREESYATSHKVNWNHVW
jgi:hypothetical protein